MSTAPDQVVYAASRLRDNLAKAKEDNSYTHAWYAHMRRWDIETLIEHVLGPEATQAIGVNDIDYGLTGPSE